MLAFLFSPEAGDRDGHCVDTIECENTKHTLSKKYWKHSVLCRVSAVYPHDCVADWEEQLSATVQHHKNIVPFIASLGKDQHSKSEGFC